MHKVNTINTALVNREKTVNTALIIEDCLTDLTVLSRYLEQEGLKVLTASSGEEALEKISTSQPDVIILDVVLPGCSGFEVCRDLKAESKTSNIPIIICSTKGSEMDRYWGLRQGADVYLSKPIDQEELGQVVKKLLKL